MKYVIDCSFSSALFLPDEKSNEIRNFFVALKPADQVFVPLLWWYETVNVLSVSIKRKRLRYNEINRILALLEKLPLETDINHSAQYSKDIFDLTQLYHVSAYDAAYLELAVRKKSKILSLDEAIVTASRNIGI
jgi:predicted nucleic acid-binding protein